MTDELDLRALFDQEATVLLERLSQGALELEDRPDDAELVASLFRAAHTLKGSAALVELHPIARTAHALEDLLQAVRSGTIDPTTAVVDAVLDTVDAVREAIPRLMTGADPGPAPDAAAARVRAVLEGTAMPPAAAPPPAAPPLAAPGPDDPEPDPPAAPDHGGEETIAVPLSRLDRLVRLAGEGRTARLRLAAALGEHATDPEVDAALVDLERALGALQRQTLQARMVTFERIAEPLRRGVRDVARATGKEVDYALDGEGVELDRGVLDALREPLLHLVRNAVDHGIEPPGERVAAGKAPSGTLRIAARRRGADLVVEVRDDGRGLDPDALRARLPGAAGLSDAAVVERLFEPGVSTATAVTDLSGRGVGLDAVRTALQRVRGTVRAAGEPGRGTTFTLTVPVTLAVVRCLLVATGGERYAIPSHAVSTVVEASADALVGLEGGRAVWVGGDVVPVAELHDAVGAAPSGASAQAVVLATGGRRLALRVDALLGQRDVTVQELGRALGRVELVAGASIDADGSVLLVLDPVALAARAGALRAPAAPSTPADAAPSRAAAGATVLVVDDALTVRELQRAILERAGYAVLLAEDGEAALRVLDRERPDLVLTDVEMPRLDGFGLVEMIRGRADLAGMPVLIVSSRDDEADRRRGLEAGADGYIVKQAFDEPTLLGWVGRMLGTEDLPA
ncbi:response regulator [Conexibacter sp. SYSU D00693]|uniref:hybrid sensor histidine kinase/response regulator n=1 Tax=Conexibacter sp. SYSU D00693 TaxID=2812560 RepID=UPI00196AF682|nr:response regulator [Conexibacter sp. SYSU D00693]